MSEPNLSPLQICSRARKLLQAEAGASHRAFAMSRLFHPAPIVFVGTVESPSKDSIRCLLLFRVKREAVRIFVYWKYFQACERLCPG